MTRRTVYSRMCSRLYRNVYIDTASLKNIRELRTNLSLLLDLRQEGSGFEASGFI